MIEFFVDRDVKHFTDILLTDTKDLLKQKTRGNFRRHFTYWSKKPRKFPPSIYFYKCNMSENYWSYISLFESHRSVIYPIFAKNVYSWQKWDILERFFRYLKKKTQAIWLHYAYNSKQQQKSLVIIQLDWQASQINHVIFFIEIAAHTIECFHMTS